MNVTVETAALAGALKAVRRAANARSSLPVLANVLLAVEDGRLRLSATDLDLALTAWIHAEASADGAVTLPAKTLADLVASLDAERVSLLLDERRVSVQVSAGRTRANVKGIEAAQFPLVPRLDPAQALALDAAAFAEMIGQVVYAAATDSCRPTLTGAHLTLKGSELRLVAVDGFRMASRKLTLLAEPAPPPVEAIIPRRALEDLAALLDPTQPLLAQFLDGRVLFRSGEFELVAQLLEGRFPDVDAVVPRSHTTRAIVEVESLRLACRSAEVIAREAAHNTLFILDTLDPAEPDRPALRLRAVAAETGESEISLPAVIEGQAGWQIAFNVRYVADVLAACGADRVAIELTTPTSPGVFRPEGRDDYFCTLMPMHVRR